MLSNTRNDLLNSFLIFLTLVVYILFIEVSSYDSKSKTLLLFFIVLFTGNYLIKKYCVLNYGKSMKIFHRLFLIKLILSLFILSYGWIPQLDMLSESYGYDAQRYYFQGNILAQHNFNPKYLPSINYNGIIYYWAYFFHLFGHNPLVPLLVNNLTTLIAIIVMVDIFSKLDARYPDRYWMFSLLLFSPEIVWYDVISSRESIVLSLLVCGIWPYVQLLYSSNYKLKRLNILKVVISSISILLIISIRPPVLITLFSLLMFPQIFLLKKTKYKWKFNLLLVVVIALLTMYYNNTKKAHRNKDFEYGNVLSEKMGFEEQGSETESLEGWSQNSFGRKLIPKNIVQAIFLAPIRIIVYMIAPLPNIVINFKRLVRGEWGEWQLLFDRLSSLVYLLTIPLYVLYLIKNIKNKTLTVNYWVYAFLGAILTVVIGNLFIHQRYRVMVMPYYLVSLLSFDYSSKFEITIAYRIFGFILVGLFLLYVFTKQII